MDGRVSNFAERYISDESHDLRIFLDDNQNIPIRRPSQDINGKRMSFQMSLRRIFKEGDEISLQSKFCSFITFMPYTRDEDNNIKIVNQMKTVLSAEGLLLRKRMNSNEIGSPIMNARSPKKKSLFGKKSSFNSTSSNEKSSPSRDRENQRSSGFRAYLESVRQSNTPEIRISLQKSSDASMDELEASAPKLSRFSKQRNISKEEIDPDLLMSTYVVSSNRLGTTLDNLSPNSKKEKVPPSLASFLGDSLIKEASDSARVLYNMTNGKNNFLHYKIFFEDLEENLENWILFFEKPISRFANNIHDCFSLPIENGPPFTYSEIANILLLVNPKLIRWYLTHVPEEKEYVLRERMYFNYRSIARSKSSHLVHLIQGNGITIDPALLFSYAASTAKPLTIPSNPKIKGFDFEEEIIGAIKSGRSIILEKDLDSLRAPILKAISQHPSTSSKIISASNTSSGGHKFDRICQEASLSCSRSLRDVIVRLNILDSGRYSNCSISNDQTDLHYNYVEFGKKKDRLRENYSSEDRRKVWRPNIKEFDLMEKFRKKGIENKSKELTQDIYRLNLTIFMLFGISSLKSQYSTFMRMNKIILSDYDIVLIKQIWLKIIFALNNVSNVAMHKIVMKFLPFREHEESLFTSFFSQREFQDNYVSYLQDQLIKRPKFIEIDSVKYPVKIGKMMVDTFDLLEVVTKFPNADPLEVKGLNRLQEDSQLFKESEAFYLRLKWMQQNSLLKVKYDVLTHQMVSGLFVNVRHVSSIKETSSVLDWIKNKNRNSKAFKIVMMLPIIKVDDVLVFKRYNKETEWIDLKDELVHFTSSKISKLVKFRETLSKRFNGRMLGFYLTSSRLSSIPLRRLRYFVRKVVIIKMVTAELLKKRQVSYNGFIIKSKRVTEDNLNFLKRRKIFHSLLLENIKDINYCANLLKRVALGVYESLNGEISTRYIENRNDDLIQAITNNTHHPEYLRLFPSACNLVEDKNTFSDAWSNLNKQLQYIYSILKSTEAVPETGFYDLSLLSRSESLFTNLAISYSFRFRSSLLNINFHATFYSDFDIEDLMLPVIRFRGLKLVNAFLSSDGMLEDCQPHTCFQELPQMVIMPFYDTLAVSDKVISC